MVQIISPRLTCGLVAGIVLSLGFSQAQGAIVPVNEGFSGTGPYSSTNEVVAGFDADGWHFTKGHGTNSSYSFDTTAGTFTVTPASGSIAAQLRREIGPGAFVAEVEFTSLSLVANSSAVLWTYDDISVSTLNAVAVVVDHSGGNYRIMLKTITGGVTGQGTITDYGITTLGTSLPDGIVLRIEHDGADGWTARYQIGAGSFQHVYTLDGEYTIPAANDRRSAVSVAGNGSTGTLNQYTLVPEPTALGLIGLAGVMLLRRRTPVGTN